MYVSRFINKLSWFVWLTCMHLQNYPQVLSFSEISASSDKLFFSRGNKSVPDSTCTSLWTDLFTVPRSTSSYRYLWGSHEVAIATLRLWNSLPSTIWNAPEQSLSMFKTLFNTRHLLNKIDDFFTSASMLVIIMALCVLILK